MSDLAVVGQDPGFRGGALAHMEAFLEAVRALGREPELLYVPHPAFRRGRRTASLDRVEPLRLLRGSRALAPRVAGARSAWVVAPLAIHGLAAALAARPYACWVGTSLASENARAADGPPTLAPARPARERACARTDRAPRAYGRRARLRHEPFEPG